ncbi:MAG: DUF3794 domain-containing protein [Oscillospiraceae bacterium]|nr:DUF3794 domain-containing protein [Oscillospiraceae bacterium]
MEHNGKINFSDRDSDNFCAADKIMGSVYTRELSDDFVLPDYLPDVKKVVWVDASASIDGRFTGSGSLEYDGSVMYRVVFISEENTLANAVFRAGYNNKIVNDELTEDCVDLIVPVVEAVNCRMQNPRKFNIRSRAGANVSIWRRGSMMPDLFGAKEKDESLLETRLGTIPAMNMMNIRESDFSLSEDITIEKTLPLISSLVYTKADIYIDECRAASDRLTVRGNCDMECLYLTQTEETAPEYTMIRRSWPVTQTIEAQGISEKYECLASVAVVNLEANVRADEHGAMRMIELDITYGIDVEAASSKQVSFVDDAYSLNRECQNVTRKKTVGSFVEAIRENFSMNESFMVSDLSETAIDTIIGSRVEVSFDQDFTESKKGNATLTGTAAVNVVGVTVDGVLTDLSTEIPVRFESHVPVVANMKIRTEARTSNIRCRVDNGKLYTDFETSFVAMVYTEEQKEIVEGIKLGADLAVATGATTQPDSAMILYYPERGERIWDIAKRYGTTRGDIFAQNNLSPEVQALPKVIIIPQR